MDGAKAPDVPGFSVDRLLGRGSSATVWLVRQEHTGLRFAMKCFDGGAPPQDARDILSDSLTADGIRREIRILSVLEHPHLVRAHKAVTVIGSCGECQALLMDYASGGSLASLVSARGQLTVGEVVTVLTPLAQVLGFLHGKGMAHSDVSPGNVLFTGQGKPLLSDLGITRLVGDPAGNAGHGTPGFTDPVPVDAVRAGLHPEGDVYGAAAVGWFCLTGSAPPRSAVRPPLTLLRPEVPKEMAAALEAGLNEDRRLRPAAAELAAAVYRSAAPLPLDLAAAVHPTVIPELLTRRHVPAKQAGPLRARLAGVARTFTAKLPGRYRRPPRMPFPAVTPETAHVRGRHAAEHPRHHGTGTGPARRPSRLRPLALGAVALLAAAGWGLSAGVSAPQGSTGSVDGTVSSQATGAPEEATRGAGTPEERATGQVKEARKLASAPDPADAVLGLAALRSLAFSLGRPELLDEVNRTGSPADAADRRTVNQLIASDTVLAGFTTALSDVRSEAGASGGGAVVQATSTTSAYEERDSTGTVVGVGRAGRPQPLRLVLVSDAGNWRITEILAGGP
ncbi:serine/threonine protein kinase [Pseudarthrobacter sp. NPDC092419]|uniref:serine/threonine protein kinase n=1 Tax=Pseudarthrobacter sp. NPDC092419 TaxID=3364414 RepID=UPI003820720D